MEDFVDHLQQRRFRISQLLSELVNQKQLSKYLASSHSKSGSIDKMTFEEWKEVKGYHRKRPDPSLVPESKDPKKFLTRLVPDWERRRRLISLKMKTILKIYLSKWFYVGLEWFEIDLVLLILDRFPLGLECDILTPEALKETGWILFSDMALEDENRSFDIKGWWILEWGNLEEFLFTESDFHNVWKLRTVQSLRDFIFSPLTSQEHEGKKGIRKPRIRGYRDGKASPRDPRRTLLARQVDILFFQEKEEARLRSVYEEIESFLPGFLRKK